MMDMKFVASVEERDIDFVLLEELSVNKEFCDWFTSRVYRRPIFASTIGAWHSVIGTKGRESDIVYLFKSDDDGRMAVLIENKIDAPPQPQQGVDYRERGREGKQNDDWDDFITCIVAPAQYLSSGKQAESYDRQVSYEEVMSFFVSRRARDTRYLYKAQLIREAIEKNRRGYQAILSPEMSNFVKAYVEFVEQVCPSCGVQEAKPRPAGSTWVIFKPAGISQNVSLAHQLTAGFSKLFVANTAEQAETFKARFAPHLTPDVEFGVSGKSVTLSLAVPKIDPLGHSFEEEKPHVRTGIEAVDLLTRIYRRAMSEG
jgi:hypothetical protein